MITGITGSYRRRADESVLHAQGATDQLTALLMARYKVSDDTDFHIEFDHDGILPDEGDAGPRGWLLLDIESDHKALADGYEAVRQEVTKAQVAIRAAGFGYETVVGVAAETVAVELEAFWDRLWSLDQTARALHDAEAAEAMTWVYEVAGYNPVDLPYGIDEAEVYEAADAAGQDAWDAVHAHNRRKSVA